MKQPKVSIIIPCYNVENYIDRCLKSVMAQTIGIDAMQVLLINDASTDETLQKLMEWHKRYEKQIEVYSFKTNRRQGAARNYGMQFAKAEYIGFVDADDFIEPDMYEVLYAGIKNHDADMACIYGKLDEGKNPVEMGRFGTDEYLVFDTLAKRKTYMLYQDELSGVWGKLIRRSFLEKNEIDFPEKLTYEDNYFTALCKCYVNDVVVIRRYLYHYFYNPESTIHKRNAEYIKDRLVIEEKKIAAYYQRGFLETYYNEIEFQFLQLYYVNTLHLYFTRYDTLLAEPIIAMHKRVLELFPNVCENPYLNSEMFPKELMMLTDSLKTPLTVEKIETLYEAYKKLLIK